MVVVKCMILCFKFGKHRLSAGLRPDALGELTAFPQTHKLGRGGSDGKGEMEGQDGE